VISVSIHTRFPRLQGHCHPKQPQVYAPDTAFTDPKPTVEHSYRWMSLKIESSPTSFHTVQEFQSPSFFPSWSDFEGFSDDDNWPLQSSSLSSNAALPSVPLTALAAPPINNPDTSLRTFLSSEDALSFCQSWARDHGYAIRKCRTKSRRKEKTV
jgi:hypothetical protein